MFLNQLLSISSVVLVIASVESSNYVRETQTYVEQSEMYRIFPCLVCS